MPVIDADVSRAMPSRPARRALRRVVARFGGAMLLPDGSLDRAALGRVVFSDRAARADLEAIVHPEVYRRISEWFAKLPPRTRVAIADIPLLFETGHTHDFDRVIVAACGPGAAPAADRARRTERRDARARLAAQWPIEEKEARADYVIRTDATIRRDGQPGQDDL